MGERYRPTDGHIFLCKIVSVLCKIFSHYHLLRWRWPLSSTSHHQLPATNHDDRCKGAATKTKFTLWCVSGSGALWLNKKSRTYDHFSTLKTLKHSEVWKENFKVLQKLQIVVAVISVLICIHTSLQKETNSKSFSTVVPCNFVLLHHLLAQFVWKWMYKRECGFFLVE